MPVIPSATLSQLQYNRYLVPPNPPALPSLPPAHPAQAVQTVQSVQSVQTVQSVQSVQSIQPVQSVQSAQSSRIQQSTQQTQQSAQQSTQPLSNASLLPSSSAFSQNAPRSQHSSIFPSLVNQPPAPSTPPSAPRLPPLVTPPLLPHSASENGNPLFPVPARPFAQPPPEPVIRPQPVLQFQQIHVANTRAQPFFYPRYIAKVSLVGNGPGQIVSKFKIPGGFLRGL